MASPHYTYGENPGRGNRTPIYTFKVTPPGMGHGTGEVTDFLCLCLYHAHIHHTNS